MTFLSLCANKREQLRGELVCLFLRIGYNVHGDHIQQRCAAWMGESEEGKQFRKLLESKRRDRRFDNRRGGRLGMKSQEESQRCLLVPNLCIERKQGRTHIQRNLADYHILICTIFSSCPAIFVTVDT